MGKLNKDSLNSSQHALILEYFYLVEYAVTKKYHIRESDSDHDNAMSDATFGLCEAARTWKDGKSTFKTWAITRIKGAIIDGFRKRLGRINYKKRPTNISLDSFEDHENDIEYELSKTKKDSPIDVEKIFKLLNSREREIVRLKFWDGLGFDELSKRFKITEAKMILIMMGIYKKLRIKKKQFVLV